ncbi:MAG TPA: MarR family transcriptional regulator [Actinomycetota bacterium]|nr:MarR family transcriptional regulator [Actinomycetota bacterium]
MIRDIGIEVRMSQNLTDAIDQSVCAILGINRSDARCLDIVERHGRITAGDLAAESGLTTGAVTALLDRLERGGAVRRVPDPGDRRRVLVELTPAAQRTSNELYGPMAEAAASLLSRYSRDELLLIRDFLRRGREMSTEQLARIQSSATTSRTRSGELRREVRRAALEVQAARDDLRRELKAAKQQVKQDVKAVKQDVKREVKRTSRQVKDQLKDAVKRSVR